ncbi:MAG: hypothetical protein HGA22_10565, partial [Clostridiales bacterium]|nr:hypothetical protein [Clostridiales bacterium]
MRKRAAFLVLIILLSGLSGCTGSAGSGQNVDSTALPADTGTSSQVAVAGPQAQDGAADATVLRIWSMAFNKSFPSGVQEDPVAREITRKTGIIMDITPSNSFADYNDTFAAALASDDLPDIASVP